MAGRVNLANSFRFLIPEQEHCRKITILVLDLYSCSPIFFLWSLSHHSTFWTKKWTCFWSRERAATSKQRYTMYHYDIHYAPIISKHPSWT